MKDTQRLMLFFPQFTVKRNGLYVVCVYRFIRLYARVSCRPQDFRFSAEKFQQGCVLLKASVVLEN